ncbi:MAG TPA: VWA domain-containing protein [Terriglobales bacterium]|nr:VWA domain-containing protein [Terriglobales bacterium]
MFESVMGIGTRAVSNILCSFYFSFAILAFAATSLAQSVTDEVHIQPLVTGSAPSASSLTDPSLKLPEKSLKVDVDLVLLPVSITDVYGRPVVGLDKSRFEVFEGKEEQEIRHFSSEDAPMSVGIILDSSGSMKEKAERAREAVVEFCRVSNPQDEFFLITFNDSPQEVAGFTSRVEDIQNRLVFTQPKGRTALFDAIYLGLNQLKKARYSRKALLIVSDGGDNHSRYTEREVRSQVEEADVLIYAIGLYDHTFQTPEERLGPIVLRDISEVTGGRTFTVDDPNTLPTVAALIATELRNQYVLGYRPAASSHDGKWHKVKVKMKMPKGFSLLQIHSRTGYYASAQ